MNNFDYKVIFSEAKGRILIQNTDRMCIIFPYRFIPAQQHSVAGEGYNIILQSNAEYIQKYIFLFLCRRDNMLHCYAVFSPAHIIPKAREY